MENMIQKHEIVDHTGNDQGTRAGPHPTVEQRVQHVIRGGLRPPLQDLREEQELEQSTAIRSRLSWGVGLASTSKSLVSLGAFKVA